MKKTLMTLIIAVGATGLAAVHAQDAAKRPQGRPPATKTTAKAAPAKTDEADKAAIKALLDAFTKAFDAGDADAAAATYSETAVIVDELDQRVEGRAAIRDQYAAAFAENPGSTIAIEVAAFRFLSPDTALEEGRTTITPAPGTGDPEHTRFTAIYVKQGGHWLQAAVRDEVVAAEPTPHERLEELEWLVGDWINESQSAIVETSCKWTDDGNFLVRDFTMKTQGEPVLSGTMRIGWDPVRGQFKTWIFDSEGGFGEGYWTRDGESWLIKAEGVRQDGKHASATSVITRLGKDRANWRSVDRSIGGIAVPGIDEFTIVRKPPAPGTGK